MRFVQRQNAASSDGRQLVKSVRCFTLLEVMIAIFLIAIAASVVGINVSKALEDKQFQTSADRLYCELESCRRIAFNMQADWIVTIEMKMKRISLKRSCPETGQSFTIEWDAAGQLYWNSEILEPMNILFSSTGKISPTGCLEYVGQRKSVQWVLPQVFHIAEGSDGALIRPDEARVEHEIKAG